METSRVCPSGDECQGVWRRGTRRVGVQAHRDLFDRLTREGVEDPDRRAVAAGHEQALAILREHQRVRVLLRVEFLEQEHRREHVDLNARSAPERDVQHASVRRDHAAVGLGRQRDRLGDLAGREVNRRHGLSEDARDEQRLAVGADREPARKALAGDGGQREGARAGDRAVGVVELLHVVLAGAGGVEPGAVGMPHESEPGVVERHGALHRPVRDVDDGERRPRQPVAGDDQVAGVGRLNEVERQVADAHVFAGGLNAPAVGQQRGAVGHGARQGSRRQPPIGRLCAACSTRGR